MSPARGRLWVFLSLLVIAAGTAVSSAWLQTRVARAILERRLPGGAALARAHLGWDGTLQVSGVTLPLGPGRLTIDTAEAEFEPWPLLRRKEFRLGVVRIRGFRLRSADAPPGVTASPGSGEEPAAALRAALAGGGLLPRLDPPLGFTVESVEADGVVVLPGGRGELNLVASGGGFAPGREGRLEITWRAALAGRELQAGEGRLGVRARMETPRRFSRVDLEVGATARGARFPGGVSLAGTATAERGPTGESYRIALRSGDGREVLRVEADEPSSLQPWRGRWRAAASEADLAPLTPGITLPAAQLAGEGTVGWVWDRSEGELAGRLRVRLERPEQWRPELAAVGPVEAEADFQVRAGRETLAVERLEVTLAGASPVARLRVLRPFSLDGRRGEVTEGEAPGQDLVAVELAGVPWDWAGPAPAPWQWRGGAVRGTLVARWNGRGMDLRVTEPLLLDRLAVNRSGQPWVEGLEAVVRGTAHLGPDGWALAVEEARLVHGGAEIVSAEGRAGRLAGSAEPWKAAARLRFDLGAARRQPFLARLGTLGEGVIEADWGVTVAEATSLHAHVRTAGWRAGKPAVALPDLRTDLRADVAPDGVVRFRLPAEVTGPGGRSDLLLTGTFRAGATGGGRIEVEATGRFLAVEDLRGFTALVPPAPDGRAGTAGGGAAGTPVPWAGWSGTADVRLEEVALTGTTRLESVQSRFTLDEGKIRVEQLESGLRTGGRLHLSGDLSFAAREARPFGLAAAVLVKDWEPAAWWRAHLGGPGPLDGRLDATGSFSSRAERLGGLLEAVEGEVHLSSRGGVFRGVPVALPTTSEAAARRGGWLAAADRALGGLGRRRDPAVPLTREQAAAELAAALHPIAFDQFSVVVARDVARTLTFRHLVLISPELRLTGGGSLRGFPGESAGKETLALELQLHARGRAAELLRQLGAMDDHPDEWGYARATLPVRLGGTLARPDASDLAVRLSALALERVPLSERALEWFGRVRGGR